MAKKIDFYQEWRTSQLPELHLKEPVFTYSSCGSSLNIKKKFRETGNLKHLYRDELDKACSPYDAAYSDSKGLATRTISDRILKQRANDFTRSKNDWYQRALADMVYHFLVRKKDPKWL